MKTLAKALTKNSLFWTLAAISVLLIIAGFVVPPLGQIDPSVLTAIGILLGFCAIDTVNRALERGVDATVRHGDLEVEINNENKEK